MNKYKFDFEASAGYKGDIELKLSVIVESENEQQALYRAVKFLPECSYSSTWWNLKRGGPYVELVTTGFSPELSDGVGEKINALKEKIEKLKKSCGWDSGYEEPFNDAIDKVLKIIAEPKMKPFHSPDCRCADCE